MAAMACTARPATRSPPRPTCYRFAHLRPIGETGAVLRLAKHHGLGNDFLIRLDGDVDAAMARAVCDRRTGVGADGLISVVSNRWTLFNADGSRAESSGNGLRCAAQAVARARGVTELDITFDTDAGPRRVQLNGDIATVEMGAVTVHRLGDDDAEVSTGNPHLVLRVP